MRQETELFKEKIEVSLDGRQVFYLFFGGAVVASLVFVLGVMVGKRVEARAHGESAALATTADPLDALDQLGQRDRKSFRSALIDGDEDPRFAVDDAIAASDAARDKAAAAARDKDAREKAAKKQADRDKAAQEKAAQEKAAREKAAQDAGKSDAKNQPADQQPAEKAAPEPAKPAAKKAPNWTLQLSSFQDRVEADSFFDKLKEAGYSPYITETEVPEKGLYYRVRLGGYQTYDEAIDAKHAFEKSQGIIAYVTRLKTR